MSAGAALDAQAFACLFLNAGCLAERTLMQALQAAAAMPAAPGAAGAPLSPQADGLDWEALDGLSLGRPEAALRAAVPAPEDRAELAALASWLALGPPAVYGAAQALAPRLARLHVRADVARLATLLAALPADAMPLHGPLDAAGFERWNARLAQGLPALETLVTELRALDPPL